MNNKTKIAIQLTFLLVYALLLRTDLSGLIIYLIGIVFNLIYHVVSLKYANNEDKEKINFINDFLSKETVNIIQFICVSLSWLLPLINIFAIIKMNNNENDNN